MVKKRSVVPWAAAALLLTLGGCTKTDTDASATDGSGNDLAAEEAAPPAAAPTGNDYHSTSLRARRRGIDKLEGVNLERTEQVEQEKSFGRTE